jgi:hypothetical protein
LYHEPPAAEEVRALCTALSHSTADDVRDALMPNETSWVPMCDLSLPP